MFLPKLTGSLNRRYDQLESHVPLNPRPLQSKRQFCLSPTLTIGLANSLNLNDVKLLNAKRKTTFTGRAFAELYRTNLTDNDRTIRLNRKLKSLTLKQSSLVTKRLAFEAKQSFASSISYRYGVSFKKSEVHLLSELELEQLAKKVSTERNRVQAATSIQRYWKRHRVKELKTEAERLQQAAALIIQHSWRRYMVRGI